MLWCEFHDHVGKININRIPRRNMQLLIEKTTGGQDADCRSSRPTRCVDRLD